MVRAVDMTSQMSSAGGMAVVYQVQVAVPGGLAMVPGHEQPRTPPRRLLVGAAHRCTSERRLVPTARSKSARHRSALIAARPEVPCVRRPIQPAETAGQQNRTREADR